MILSLFTIDTPKSTRAFEAFSGIVAERYSRLLAQPLQAVATLTQAAAIKPIHAGVLPYMVMDLLIHSRRLPCHIIMAQDVLDFGAANDGLHHLQEAIEQLQRECPKNNVHQASVYFRGFGPRIDMSLNTICLLFMDILMSLTQVEGDALTCLRARQFERYENPMELKTFGLQKVVANDLGKSPVAIHKSLRSAKFDLICHTVRAMQEIIS